ncbi:ExeA family protein [Desulforhopalus sp. IMCC35007]|uniref:ExeA family protein n=1 Tax=Desulforhopalus sp. IMCC35007 TaxID=2569543 RepID=UPI0010ADE63E|nr:AAA family ATPase [Desulforhopalus sp. IMCC35007]TKB12205.1 AAA family ATPase [Desulforhopalus sp. IMCC35007]
MYRTHFGLHKKPFELTPDTKFLFLGETHKEALGILKRGVVSDKGFLLFTGGVGTGKTTLINVLSKTLENPGYLCVISNPTLEIDDFFYYFAAQLGLLFDGNKAKFLFLFSKLLEECKKTERKVLLIIDEAHALPTDLLEELRLLVNMAAEIKGVLSVFLVGQPELLDRLNEEQLSPLAKRIAVRYHLSKLSKQDALQYIQFRLKRAGADKRSIFTEKALELIYLSTSGNPRQINIICDNALLAAYLKEEDVVEASVVRKCVEQLAIPGDNLYYLPPEKKLWKRWWVWLIIGVLLAEIVFGIFAWRQGWLDSLYSYLLKILHLD